MQPAHAEPSTILVVDDRAENRLALRAVLEASERRIVEAGSGEEALRFLLKEKCSLLLLDVQMPGLDGFETAELIRRRPAMGQVPIVFITATSREEASILRGYAHGAIDYLVKPVLPELLRAKVCALLELQARSERAAQRARDREADEQRRSLLARERSARDRADRERRRADAAGRRAEDAHRVKDDFLSALSHELRTPLTSILGWTRLLRMGKADPTADGPALTTIERNARLQARMIDDLLDVQRMAARKLQPSSTEVDLARLAEEAAGSLRPLAEAKGILLSSPGADAASVSVCGDHERLWQVVCQLIANAIKFTAAEGRVEVRVGASSGWAVLSVRDDGQGIEPEFLPYVFEPFRQQEPGLARAQGGLGIGLSLVRELARLHGGSVAAESAGRGRGSRFVLKLPLLGAGAQAHAAKADPEPSALSGLRVLVVEDDADSRFLISAMLEEFGASVVGAGSGVEAFAALEHQPVDVILSDISMPGEDGYALLRRIRALHPSWRVPAAALTAHTRIEDRQRALDAGFQAHIPKPIEPGELASVLLRIVHAAPGDRARH